MKKLKLIFSAILLVAAFGCTEDDSETDFVDRIAPPTNVSATTTVTQDNTGLVTITPVGEGVVTYVINFGDGSDVSDEIEPGEHVQHVYEEGTYEIAITATGLNNLSTTVTQQLNVSFQAPQNLEVTIENDGTISKTVHVTATADLAVSYDVYFGETDNETPVTTNIGETTTFTYQEAGTYTIMVVAMGAAIETTSYSEEFEVTEVLAPIVEAPAQPNRAEADVVSIYSGNYTNIPNTDYYPNWGQTTTFNEFDVNGDTSLQYGDLTYQGIQFGETVDVSQMEYLHIDVWTASEGYALDIYPISIATGEQLVQVNPTAGEWSSFDIAVSDFTDQGLSMADIHQFKFVGTPNGEGTVFIDNLYFYKSPSTANSLVGTWKLAQEAGALGVGPAPGDIGWWNCDDTCVVDRACYYDDEYIFGADGSFTNVLGADTWIEGWQGGTDSCGTPVAPYDGTAVATYTHDAGAGTVTINGTGAYIGLPKANNQGELPNVAVPSSITYSVTFLDADTISVIIEAGAGVFWQYKLVREGGSQPSPLEGTWQMAPEAGALGVGPAPGDTSWWNCDATCVSDRACYYDDQYVFGADGSFTNVLGSDTWIEGWQGGTDSCGAPVAPYDGTAIATFNYDAGAGTVTINGTGAYIGLPKANNQGELPNVAVPSSITYSVTFLDANTINVVIEAGAGVFWQYKLIKL